VFPTERYGLDGEEGYLKGKRAASETDPTKPIGSWKTAWTNARKDAKVQCRWHDARHTFLSRLGESQASDATIMSLAGHVSRKMMERYSHTRGEAKKSAIAVLDEPPRGLA
jgi:integrase